MEPIIEKILAHGWFEFAHQGKTYLIQRESNKGWDYLSLWCTAPGFTCMSRVFLDGLDGVSEDTIQELLSQSFSDEHTVREMMHEILLQR